MSIPRNDENPFAPPKAAVLEAESPDGELVPDGQKVDTSRGIAWFGEGWRIFKASPGIWVLMFVIFMVLSFALAIVPMGSLVSSLCYPVVVAGIMMGCQSLEAGGTLEVAHLFAGFKKNVGNLLLVGILYLVGMMLIGFIAGVSMALMIPLLMGSGTNFNPSDFSSVMAVAPWILLVVLVVLALMLPLIMALWFAPALVVFHDMQPMASMRSSFAGCLKNFLPFLVYGVVGLILGVLALIPFGLGLLVLGPLMWGTMYAGYRDIFVRRA
jgi:hypothetical protein